MRPDGRVALSEGRSTRSGERVTRSNARAGRSGGRSAWPRGPAIRPERAARPPPARSPTLRIGRHGQTPVFKMLAAPRGGRSGRSRSHRGPRFPAGTKLSGSAADHGCGRVTSAPVADDFDPETAGNIALIRSPPPPSKCPLEWTPRPHTDTEDKKSRGGRTGRRDRAGHRLRRVFPSENRLHRHWPSFVAAIACTRWHG
jgi:hypothetical protein